VSWAKQSYLIACPIRPQTVLGWVYNGLGLTIAMRGSPNGRRPPTWVLTHLGSGHAIATIRAPESAAFQISTEIAEAGEWDFVSLHGWKDRFPDAPERVAEILARYPGLGEKGAGGGMKPNESVARMIAMATAA
jgi:hypothetical protein